MKLIELNKKHYRIPERWDELTATQLPAVMKVMFLKGYRAEEMVLQLLRVLTGMSNYQFFRCSVDEMSEYFYLLAFLLQPEIEFTKNVMPVVNVGGENFFGPDDALSNLRMKEFTNTEHFFMEWHDGGRKPDDTLNELVATLYRPALPGYNHERNENGDHREPYNQNVSRYHANHEVKLWAPSIKLAIATWYNGCRTQIARNNPDVFGGSGEPAQYGMVSVMLDVAESHVFGTFKEVEDQYVNIVLMQLNELVRKAERMKAEAKRTEG